MTNEQRTNLEKIVVEEAILLYFNNYLLDSGLISAAKHGKMISKITARTASKRKKTKNQKCFKTH